MSNDNVVLVTGATGQVGRQVVSLLLREGAHVGALTLNPESAGLPREVDLVRGDLAAPETLDGVATGVDTGEPGSARAMLCVGPRAPLQ